MNVREILESDAKQFGAKTALICNEETVVFDELLVKSRRLANGLAGLGISKGDKVALMMLNSVEYVVSYMALFSLGAVAVPLDVGIKDELKSYIEHSDVKCLIADRSPDSEYSRLVGRVPALKHVLYRQEQLADLIRNGSDAPIKVTISDDDPSVIFYTSGTTGRPKGVLWNYRHLGGGAKAMGHRKLIQPSDIKLCAIPMSHSAGIAYIMFSAVFGSTLVIMDRFNPVKFIANIEKYRVTCFFIVPAILEAILALKRSEEITLPSVRWIAIFGSMSSPLLAGRLQKLFEKAIIFGGYGLTETAPPTTLPDFEKKLKPGGVGQAMPWVEMRIVDEKGMALPAGEVGEVVIKSWVVMVEYFLEPEMTRSVMKDGWFHTGDFGRMDEDGDLFLVGRKKVMVIVGGLNIYPEEVEAVLMGHQDVREAAVIGVTNEIRGEKLKAIVALKDGRKTSREELIAHCQKHLPTFKTPRLFEFMDELPKLASGKIARRELK